MGELIPIVMFVMMGAVGVSFSPVGKAIARRLGGEAPSEANRQTLAEVEALRDELAGVYQQLEQVQERLDFAERLLAQTRERGQVGPGGQ